MPSFGAGLLQLGRVHGESGVDVGVDGLALGFEVEGCGGVVGGAGVGGHAHVGGAGDGSVAVGVLGSGVGEFDEGGEAGAEGFGVFAGALDCFADCLLAGGAVDG